MNSIETEIELNDLSMIFNMKIFQQLLADELVLYAKTLKASSKIISYNNENDNFFYKKFKLLEQVLMIVNDHIRKLNFNSQGKLTDGLKKSNLKQFDFNTNNSEHFIINLLEDHKGIIKFINQNLRDGFTYLNGYGSLDLIAEILQLHIEMTWMLKENLIQINYSNN